MADPLARLLDLLGVRDEERISISHQAPGGEFATVGIFPAAKAPQKAAEASGSVWFGVNPTTARSGRGTAADVSRVDSLYLDLDHKPEGLGSEANARTLIDNLAVIGMPSAIVSTGGGLQPYWILKDGSDVAKAAAVLRRFERYARRLAKEMDLGTIDTVSDVARVLRVPGTFNHKYDPPREVTIEFCDDGDVLDVDDVAALLDELGIADEAETSGGVQSEAGAWAFRDKGACDYVIGMVEGWKTDTAERGRHPWLVAQAVRLAAAHRHGCLSGKALARAQAVLGERFAQMCDEAPRRRVGRHEIGAALDFGVEIVERKTDEQVASELGGHEHGGAAAAGSNGGRKARRNMRQVVLDLAQQEFQVGSTLDGRMYLVELAGPQVALYEAAAKARIAKRIYEMTGDAPGRTPLEEAFSVVRGWAADVGKIELPLRVTEIGRTGVHILDSGAVDGWCIEISMHGWRMLDRSPVVFHRSRATNALPIPMGGGSLDELWEIINVAEHDREVLKAWLVACLIRRLPHPILRIEGAQGAAKTSASKYTGGLIDPSSVDTLSPPKDSASWETTANARWMIPIDNVSKIEPWWSDDLCRTSTGAGSLARALYTDNDVVTKFTRGCVILNGITTSGSLRPDLGERLLAVELVRPTAYRTEDEMGALFDALHPRLLGALLDEAVATLAALPDVEAPTDLRMADFARLATAYDRALGGAALERFRGLAAETSTESLHGDGVALTVIDFMERRRVWQGTASDLLNALTEVRARLIQERMIPSSGAYWPETGPALGKVLTRSEKLLRDRGIEVRRERSKLTRAIELTRDDR